MGRTHCRIGSGLVHVHHHGRRRGEYTHAEGCSITGGYVHRGTSVPSLYGWYLFADCCGGWIRAVPAHAAQSDPTELVHGLDAVVSFAELDDGGLVVLIASGAPATWDSRWSASTVRRRQSAELRSVFGAEVPPR